MVVLVGFVLSAICFSRFESRSQFFLGPMQSTWYEARDFCASQGAVLATIRNEEEQQEAIQRCRIIPNEMGCWIGLNDEKNAGYYEWEDGSPLCYGFNRDGTPTIGNGPWRAPSQPNKDEEQCMEIITFIDNYGTEYTGWGDWECPNRMEGDRPLCRKTCNAGDECSCFSGTKFDREPMKILEGVKNDNRCCMRCSKNGKCKSWDFNIGTNQCRLFGKGITCEMTAAKGWVSGSPHNVEYTGDAVAADDNLGTIDFKTFQPKSKAHRTYDGFNLILLIGLVSMNAFALMFYFQDSLCWKTNAQTKMDSDVI